MVDFSEYSDDYKEWLKLVKEEGIYAGVNEPYRMGDTFYQILHYYHQFGIEDIDADYDELKFYEVKEGKINKK